MIFYETQYKDKQGKLRVYRTKSLTQFHERLRKGYPKSITLKYDTAIQMPFGVWSEVIAKG
jgi:hypothetical protein